MRRERNVLWQVGEEEDEVVSSMAFAGSCQLGGRQLPRY